MDNKQHKDLGFCKIYYCKEDSSFNNLLINSIKKAFFKNKSFFKSKIPKFKIIFLYSRKEMDSLWRQKSPVYMVGFANKRRITIFSPDVIEKETCWKKSNFYSTLIHEINHLYYMNITGGYKPIWLSEGLATYLQNGKKNLAKMKLSYTRLNKRFNKKASIQYNNYHLLVYYLITKYKKEIIILFLRKLKKNKNVKRLFSLIFGKDLREIVKDANKFQKCF